MKRVRGFTLLELMVVVAIVAILAGFAITAYTGQMKKSRRAEGKQALTDLALREEKYRSNNATYGTCDQANAPSTCASFNLQFTYYTIAVSFPTTGNCPSGFAKGNANSFILTATPKGAQASDTQCATIVLTNDCGTTSKTSTPSGGTCW